MKSRLGEKKEKYLYGLLCALVMFAALIPVIKGEAATVYRVYMTGIQAGTFFAAGLLFKRIFKNEGTKRPVFWGILLYMTCPYRLYVCYDLADIFQAAVWMAAPLYLWAVVGIVTGEKKIWNMVVLATVLPEVYWLACRLFGEGYSEWDIPLQSIMPSGYRIGQFFSSYAFRDGHPGMGLGMLICLLAMIWLGFVEGMGVGKKRDRICLAAALFFAVLSTCYFPWDMVQRLGGWIHRLVCMLKTPAVFWGAAFLFLCVPAADAVENIGRHENKWIAAWIPVSVLLACLGICVYFAIQ